MVIRVGLVKFIFTVHLWKLCSSKFIENESFVGTFRGHASPSNGEKVLNGSVTNFLGLQHRRPNTTMKNVKLQRDVQIRMPRKLENFGSERFFHVSTRDTNSFDHKNSSNRYYINYQKAYGIRYDPRKIKRSFSFKDAEDDELTTTEPFYDSTTIANDFDGDNQEDGVYDAEDGFLSSAFQNPTNWPTNITETNNLVDESHVYAGSNPSNVTVNSFTANSFTNVAKPSKIETALQHLNTRIKNLFSVNANPNTQRFLNVFNIIKFQNIPCASSKPPLTSLNGTCYHKFECDQLGGIAVDTCAGGFGVCCVCKFFHF